MLIAPSLLVQDFTTFTEQVSAKVIEADETIPELPVKDVVSTRCRNTSERRILISIDLSHIQR
jgi:hypothetical protein